MAFSYTRLTYKTRRQLSAAVLETDRKRLGAAHTSLSQSQ